MGNGGGVGVGGGANYHNIYEKRQAEAEKLAYDEFTPADSLENIE